MRTEFTIDGYLVGNIWMPGVECYKYLSYTFVREESERTSPWWNVHETLRDALLRVTNDGDFQSCAVADGVLTVTRRESGRNGERCVSRYFSLDHFPSVLDMLRLGRAGLRGMNHASRYVHGRDYACRGIAGACGIPRHSRGLGWVGEREFLTMRFDQENYANARTLASFVYMGETFRVVRRRYGGKSRRKQLMVLHGNAPVSNQGYAWKDTTDPQECARLAAAYTARYLTTRESLYEGLLTIHGTPSHGGRHNPDVTEGV